MRRVGLKLVVLHKKEKDWECFEKYYDLKDTRRQEGEKTA
jgi:hypothetical protein